MWPSAFAKRTEEMNSASELRVFFTLLVLMNLKGGVGEMKIFLPVIN
jgi:hypothetical protein